VIAWQYNDWNGEAAYLLQEKIQDSVGHSGMVENIPYDKQSVALQTSYAVHYSLQSRLCQLRMPVITQVGI
jgi:hypothetical protein